MYPITKNGAAVPRMGGLHMFCGQQGRAPVIGSYRDIYVTLLRGQVSIRSGRSGDAAFILSFDRDLDLDASAAYMFATLGSVSLWNGTGSQLASCPIQENLYFGIRDVQGLTDELAVTYPAARCPILKPAAAIRLKM